MEISGRINILGGQAVRLVRGGFDEVAVVDDDPIARAHHWVSSGLERLLLVDLDGAMHGDDRNHALVTRLVGEVSAQVTVTGGARSLGHISQLLGAGAWRVGIGTAAIIDQTFTYDVCRRFPGQIVVTFDVDRDEEIWLHGRTLRAGVNLEEGLIAMQASGAAGYMIAEVGRDALDEPPDLDALRTTLATVDGPVIAAGGVRHLDDLRSLDSLAVGPRRLDGVVVGREVSAGRFTVAEALAAVG